MGLPLYRLTQVAPRCADFSDVDTRRDWKVDLVRDVYSVSPAIMASGVGFARHGSQSEHPLSATDGVQDEQIARAHPCRPFRGTEVNMVAIVGVGTRFVTRADHLQPQGTHVDVVAFSEGFPARRRSHRRGGRGDRRSLPGALAVGNMGCTSITPE